MSKDRVSRPPNLGLAPETEMSEEMLASRTPFQSALLAAGRTDGLSAARKEQLFRSLSVAVGAPHLFGEGGLGDGTGPQGGLQGNPTLPDPAQVAGGAALKASAKVGAEGLLAKVVGAAAITGALAWGGYQGLVAWSSSPAEPAVSVVAPIAVVEAPVVLGPAPIEPAAVEAAPEHEEAAAGSAKARSKAKVSDSLAKELSLIDSARAALLRGEPAVALRTLSTYRSQFPRGALQAEATVQRVEALIATGDRASAATIGGAFLKRYPDSPYSRRIASLLGREPQVDGVRKSK